jgi:hypothetical protein
MSQPFPFKRPDNSPPSSENTGSPTLADHLRVLVFLVVGFVSGMFLYPAGTFAKASALDYVLNFVSTYLLYSVDRRFLARGARPTFMIVVWGIWSAAAFRAVVDAIKAWGTLL